MALKQKDKQRDEVSMNVRRRNLEAYARRPDAIGRGRDHWSRLGLATRAEFDAFLLQRMGHLEDIPFAAGKVQGPAVVAFINDNRWMARCECGGLAVVDPAEPEFYCHKCFNMPNGGIPMGKDAHGGYPRPILFPGARDIEMIENALLVSDDPLWRNWSALEEDGDMPGSACLNREPTPAEILAAINRAEGFNETAGLPKRKGILAIDESEAPV